jgi:hypothetical protein
MSVRPNPSSERCRLSLEAGSDISQCEITMQDILGRTVVNIFDGTLKSGTNSYEIRTDQLPEGMYAVIVRTPNGVVSVLTEVRQ